MWSFSVWFIHHGYRNLLLDFHGGFPVKTFFRKNSIDDSLRNITLYANFMFGNTFYCIRRTIPNNKTVLVIIFDEHIHNNLPSAAAAALILKIPEKST